MMDGVEILIRRECPECGGTGTEMNPIWERFYAAGGARMSVSDMRMWFWDNGYIGDPEQIPEVIPCRNCKGSGKEQQWVDINEVLTPEHLIKNQP